MTALKDKVKDTFGKEFNDSHDEGIVARTIEEQTAKLPSDIFLWASLASMGASLFYKFQEENDKALFVGQWAAPFLLLGIYNKLVKLEGSDKSDKE
ncbi:hypothetical protein [Tellurirhabdus bombi]|uniref:hypothetical protein n=1 Tax=Tellurirhabdus bombi TaxID=2907205 RepID=UPI001F39CFFC|nr:hypothetical protein [Tellurirhabdus bombi]